jgi:hypothetical protein
MKELIIVFLINILITFSATAAKFLTVVMKADNVQTFNIDEIQKLTFPVGSLKVHTKSNIEHTFLNTDIRYFSFTSDQNGTSIHIPSSENNFSLKLFPNPTKNKLNIEFIDSNDAAELAVYNIHGMIVFEKKISGKRATLDIEHLTNGFYICQVISGSKSGISTFVKN